MADANFLVLLLVGLISLVMLFAQLKLFSIDSTLQRVLEELEKANRIASPAPSAPERRQSAPVAVAPATRACPHCGQEIPGDATKCRYCLKAVG